MQNLNKPLSTNCLSNSIVPSSQRNIFQWDFDGCSMEVPALGWLQIVGFAGIVELNVGECPVLHWFRCCWFLGCDVGGMLGFTADGWW